MVTEDIYFNSLYSGYAEEAATKDFRVKMNNTYVGVKDTAHLPQSSSILYTMISYGYAKKGDVISCQTSTFVAYGLKK